MYLLRLYVAGAKSQSVKAVANIRRLCKKYLRGRHKLEIIDIYRYPRRARDEQIVAAPTLIRRLPLPLRKFIGDMSNPERILLSLSIKREDS
jgi:circadian clock protein KaiB